MHTRHGRQQERDDKYTIPWSAHVVSIPELGKTDVHLSVARQAPEAAENGAPSVLEMAMGVRAAIEGVFRKQKSRW